MDGCLLPHWMLDRSRMKTMNGCNLSRPSIVQSITYYPVASLARASLLFLPSRLYLVLSTAASPANSIDVTASLPLGPSPSIIAGHTSHPKESNFNPAQCHSSQRLKRKVISIVEVGRTCMNVHLALYRRPSVVVMAILKRFVQARPGTITIDAADTSRRIWARMARLFLVDV